MSEIAGLREQILANARTLYCNEEGDNYKVEVILRFNHWTQWSACLVEPENKFVWDTSEGFTPTAAGAMQKLLQALAERLSREIDDDSSGWRYAT